jgi:starvation-inducible outer membrane lipoprotein
LNSNSTRPLAIKEFLTKKQYKYFINKVDFTKYTNWEVREDYKNRYPGFRLWAHDYGKFCFDYFFTDGFLTQEDCASHFKKMIIESMKNQGK